MTLLQKFDTTFFEKTQCILALILFSFYTRLT